MMREGENSRRDWLTLMEWNNSIVLSRPAVLGFHRLWKSRSLSGIFRLSVCLSFLSSRIPFLLSHPYREIRTCMFEGRTARTKKEWKTMVNPIGEEVEEDRKTDGAAVCLWSENNNRTGGESGKERPQGELTNVSDWTVLSASSSFECYIRANDSLIKTVTAVVDCDVLQLMLPRR